MKTTKTLLATTSALLASTATAEDFIGTIISLKPNTTTTATTSKFQVAAKTGDVCWVGQNVDFIGGDFKSVRGGSDTCCQACKNNGCVSYSWTNFEGGTCWLKNSVSTPKVYIGSKVCIRSSEVKVAVRFDNCDMPGNDLINQRINDRYECEVYCWASNGCYAATWSNYGGGTCYYKAKVTECVYKEGVSTGVVLNENRAANLEQIWR